MNVKRNDHCKIPSFKSESSSVQSHWRAFWVLCSVYSIHMEALHLTIIQVADLTRRYLIARW